MNLVHRPNMHCLSNVQKNGKDIAMSRYLTIINELIEDMPALREQWKAEQGLLPHITAQALCLRDLHHDRTRELLKAKAATSELEASSMAMELATEEIRQELLARVAGPAFTDPLEA